MTCIEHTQSFKRYGRKWCNRRKNGVGLHIYTWEQHNGPVPEGMVVRHTCHNPKCYNIDHLVLGTQADNMRDMVEAGRQAKGERIANSVITAQQAQEIWDLKPKGKKAPNGYIAHLKEKYNCSQIVFYDIWRGKTWTHAIEK
jgi:hypothetical protein